MMVKIFDEECESDLEKSINTFISCDDIEVYDIKFSTSSCIYSNEQIYCFTALIMYSKK